MKTIARIAAAIALVLLVRPELDRYRGERVLRLGTDAIRRALTLAKTMEQARPVLDRAARRAVLAAALLPGDPRPRLLAGSARLVEGRGPEALDFYRDALETGERAEIDLNLGRAHAVAGDRPEAQAALLRALWISPALATSLPEPVSKKLLEDVARLDDELRAGLLGAPPALPDASR